MPVLGLRPYLTVAFFGACSYLTDAFMFGHPYQKYTRQVLQFAFDSARRRLGLEEVVGDGNQSLESRGFDSLPVKANHQPEASLACECGNALLEA